MSDQAVDGHHDHPITSNPTSHDKSALSAVIRSAQSALLALQHPDGHWHFELEADCTISAEYILMMHFIGEVDEQRQALIANYLRARQDEDGGYALFPGGSGDISTTTKVYYALKLAGDQPDSAHKIGRASCRERV